jgi:hypothetical protein
MTERNNPQRTIGLICDDGLVHAIGREDADLRAVDDRHRDPRARCSWVRDRERAAREIVGRELLGASAGGNIAYGLGESAQPQSVGVVHDRHDEPVEVEVDRDPEVHGALRCQCQAVVSQRAVQPRKVSERVDDRARNERQRGQARGSPHRIDARVVGDGDRAGVGRRLLRRQERHRGALANVVERDNLVAALTAVPGGGQHVGPGDASVSSASEQHRGIDTGLTRRGANRGRQEPSRVARWSAPPREDRGHAHCPIG